MADDQPGGRWASWTIPDGYQAFSIDSCRACMQTVLWCLTPRGRWSPHDRDGTSHFATCPRAGDFRRGAGRRHDTI